MGFSQIENIYEALRLMDVSIGGEVIECDGINEVLNTYHTAHLPIRVLSPMSRFLPSSFYSTKTWNSGSGSAVNEVVWNVCEYLLLDTVNQTLGQRSINGPIVEFMKNYVHSLSSGGLPLPENCWIELISIKPDVLEYPLGSNNFFYGAVVTLQIKEKIP